MSLFIRFKAVEIDSKITFKGLHKKSLKYPVRSIALVPEASIPQRDKSLLTVPEIFW